MLLPKSFLGSPSDQHLCFLWIIIHKKQHRPNNKNTSAGNTVNSLCLASSNSPAPTQTPNGNSQSTTPRQEAWCYSPQPAMTGLTATGLAGKWSPWLIFMGENNSPKSEEVKKACRSLEAVVCICAVPPRTGDTSLLFPSCEWLSSLQLCKTHSHQLSAL